MKQTKKYFIAILLALVMALCLSLVACGGDTMYTVTLQYEKTQGTVEISPAAEDGKYKEGTELTVTVTPATGYELDMFKLDTDDKAASPNSDGKFVFKVEQDTTVTVTFKSTTPQTDKFTVTKNAPENGTIEITPEPTDGKYDKNTQITVTLAPATGYEVDTFTVDEVDKKSELQNNVYTFSITANTEINATFKSTTPATQKYTLSVPEVENGTIKVEPASADGKYEEGTQITITLEPAAQYEVATFKVGGVDKKSELQQNKYSFAISGDTAIEASFSIKQFTVTTTVTGESTQGTITLSPEPTEGKYAYGAQVTVTVTTQKGYGVTPDTFTVSTDPDAELSDGEYTLTVSGDTTISVAIHAHIYSEYELMEDHTKHQAWCDTCNYLLTEAHTNIVASTTDEHEVIECDKHCGWTYNKNHKLSGYIDDGEGNCYQKCENFGPICTYETEHKPHDMEWHQLENAAEGHGGSCKNGCGYTVEKEEHDKLGEGGACSKCGYIDAGEHTCIEHLVKDENGFYDGECQICHRNALFEIDASGKITKFKDYDTLKTAQGELKIKVPAKVNGTAVTGFIDGTTKTGVFNSNTDLTDIVIAENESLTELSQYLFAGCSKLKSIVVLASVTNTGTMICYNCSALEYVVLPNTLQTVGTRFFGTKVATTLQYVYFMGSNEEWGALGSTGLNIGTSAQLKCDGEWTWTDDTHDVPKVN